MCLIFWKHLTKVFDLSEIFIQQKSARMNFKWGNWKESSIPKAVCQTKSKYLSHQICAWHSIVISGRMFYLSNRSLYSASQMWQFQNNDQLYCGGIEKRKLDTEIGKIYLTVMLLSCRKYITVQWKAKTLKFDAINHWLPIFMYVVAH